MDAVSVLLLAHPEQVLFFAPLAVIVTLIPIQLRAGMITVGWSTLGLLTFLFALTANERSFRLTGLGLLPVGVGKIVTVDIWHAAPIDRYITLIVMGAALLLVLSSTPVIAKPSWSCYEPEYHAWRPAMNRYLPLGLILAFAVIAIAFVQQKRITRSQVLRPYSWLRLMPSTKSRGCLLASTA